MKFAFKTKGFIYPIISTTLLCILIMIYCIIVGEPWTHILMDAPLFYLQEGQILIAIILAIILVYFKPTRINGLWIVLPLILTAFSFMYGPILRMIYPCC